MLGIELNLDPIKILLMLKSLTELSFCCEWLIRRNGIAFFSTDAVREIQIYCHSAPAKCEMQRNDE